MNQLIDQSLLERLVIESRSSCKEGEVADYIPELSTVSGDKLGVTWYPLNGDVRTAGDCGQMFSLQSISKLFSLLLALEDRGESAVFSKVGMEPTGESFNSMVKLELIKPGIPFNPMINAGAIVISSLIKGKDPVTRADRVLRLVRRLCGDDSITYDMNLYRSELATANRNRSLAYFLKDNRVLEGDVEEHLAVYLMHCSIMMTCAGIARIGAVLANNGIDPHTGISIVSARYIQIAKTFMVTCGMYNESGEFAIKVGLPAKSGVSGGILAVVPNAGGIGIIGPALNEKGNSVAGLRLLQNLSEHCQLSIF